MKMVTLFNFNCRCVTDLSGDSSKFLVTELIIVSYITTCISTGENILCKLEKRWLTRYASKGCLDVRRYH